MSNLLLDEQPLLVLPALATAVGLHEAIILQQMHYWLLKSDKIHDGRPWVYNSYTKWQAQFPFLSQQQIGRAIRRLEKEGYLVTGNYNKVGMDKTKWYSIEYGRLSVSEGERPLFNTEPSSFNTEQPSFASERPIPETSPEITSEKHKERAGPLTDDQREELIREFVPKLGGLERTIEIVNEAMAHKNSDRWKSQRTYLRGWLRREAEKFNGSGGSNGKAGQDIERDPDPENTRRVEEMRRSYPPGKYGG